MAGETFALSRDNGHGLRSRPDLWCRDEGPAENGGRRFWVINGAWRGVLKDGIVTIPGRETSWPATEVWSGTVPGFNDADYNEAIGWIASQLTPIPTKT